jgi:serine/threonine protein kinase/Tfp pilus assembly protein PilF
VDEKTNAEAVDLRKTTDVPNPAAPAVSADVTTALDASTGAKNTSAEELPQGEPPATEADPTVPPLGKGLPFLRPGTRPGSLGRLGHFEVLEQLGKGGFGIVLKAFDEKLQRLVAIKVLGPQLARNASARGRFVREARAAAAVSSKYVVSTYEVEEQPIPYLVMEYVAGQTLQDRIDQPGALETRDILRIGAEIAEGLAAAHKQGLIHRDIKPANILLAVVSCQLSVVSKESQAPASLTTDNRQLTTTVKIADFGLARAADDASLTQAGVIAGTPMFMSPEQARGEALDQRSDLFSLGSVLYTMCTGQPPFRASKTLGILKRVCDDTPQPVREINPDLPEALAAVVNRLLVKDPAGRFQTAAAVAERLRQHLAYLDDPSLGPPPDAPASSKTPRPRRRLRLVVAAACVLLVGACGLLLFALMPRAGRQGASPGNPGSEREPPPVAQPGPPAPADDAAAQAAAGAVRRAHEFCRRGQWAEAARESLTAVDANPKERILWAIAAAHLLMAGDRDGYRQLCGRMIEQFRGTTVVEQADSVCKVCLLLPGSADRSQLPSQVLADGADEVGRQPDYRNWFCAGLALIAYRDGQYENAVESSKKSLALGDSRGQSAALALVARALAQHQLHESDEAKKSLAEATELIPDELATLGSADFQGAVPVASEVVMPDWLIAEVLRREAALLIHKDARRTPGAAALRSRGLALFNQGKLDAALTAFRQALAQEERHAWTHHLVGVILLNQGKPDEAIPEFRRGIETHPDYVPPYVSLGTLLAAQGKTDEAIPLVEKAIELDPVLAAEHSVLGELLLYQGKLDESAARLGKAIELAPQNAAAAQLHADVLRLQALLPRLDHFVDGTAEPADGAQRLDLARLCFYRRRFAAAARFYAAEPRLLDDLSHVHRYEAACAAARAGHGDGDADKLDAAERSRLRKQAIAWLRADLDAVTKLLAAGKDAERPFALIRLRRWKVDPDLASLRDADQVGKLPDDERALLEGLWSDLDTALKRNP